MKKIFVLCLMISAMILALLGSTKTMAAQPNSEVKMAGQPSKWYFDQDNYLIIVPYQSTSFLRFGYQGKGFPDGTQTRIRELPNSTDKPWLIEYSLPGKTWQSLLWSQLICKDEQCEETKPEPEPEPESESEPEPEEFKCEFPIMGPLIFGALGYFAAEGTSSSAETSHTKAEVTVDPAIGVAAGLAIGVAIECWIEWEIWKKNHPEQKKK